MRLSRASVLVLLCASACSSARPAVSAEARSAGPPSGSSPPRQSVSPMPGTPPQQSAPAPPSAPSTTAPRDGRCGADAILEIECGFAEQGAAGPRAAAPFAECPATSAAFAGYVPRLHLWRTSYAYPQLGLGFDAALTAEARRTQSSMPSACCYATCTHLRVAPRSDAPSSQFPGEACVAMPDAPSRYPSPVEPRCPIAAVVPGDPRFAPFVRVQPTIARSPMVASWASPECCYTIPNDTPPNAGPSAAGGTAPDDDRGSGRYPRRRAP